MTEDMLHLVDLRDSTDFDLVAKRTIHEVAHQWFGHILAPKNVEGASMFVEGFAKYSEAVIMEKMYGKSAIWELSRNANNKYFTYRSYENTLEPPIYKVHGQGYLSYGKNFTVMIALRDLIGEETLNKAIRKFVDKYRGKVKLEVTSIEFLNEIYKVTPSKDHTLIDDWFKRVITYDLVIDDVKITNTIDGRFSIEIDIISKRFETLNDGSTKPIQIDEYIQIGVFSKHPKQFRLGDTPIYLNNHHFDKEKSRITLILDEKPNYISIDPYGTRSDENLSDNTFSID
jgi:aminopeptidase N